MVLVERRNAASLLPPIRQYIVFEKAVVSDQWAVYSTVRDVPEGNKHQTANHRLRLIDPETAACTNTINSLRHKPEEGNKPQYEAERALLTWYRKRYTVTMCSTTLGRI